MAHSEVPCFVLRREVLCTPFWVIAGFHCMAKMAPDSPEEEIPLYCGTGGRHLLCAVDSFPHFSAH